MKLLFITIIALVIPAFFALVFVMSAVNKLTNLRNRCREARQRLNTTPSAATPSSDLDLKAQQEYLLAMEQYNLARKRFPISLLAFLWGFRDVEPFPGNGRQATLR